MKNRSSIGCHALVEHLGLDPDRVMCDFHNGPIDAPAEFLAALLGIDPPKAG